MSIIETWKKRADALKKEIYALYFACRDPRVPWYAKLWIACIVAYAFSPIDLIPDFIPVIGHLDDLIILPLGIVLAIKMIPPEVMADCRARSETLIKQGKPQNWIAAAIVVAVWALVLVWITIHFLRPHI